jgi:uncharacterized membrane protein YphA (DoxX/SURF4 family)
MSPDTSIPVVDVLRVCVGAIFAYAGIAKLRQLTRFVAGLEALAILPNRWAAAAALLVAASETAVGLLLLAGVAVPLAAAWALGLLMIFGVVQSTLFRRESPQPCLCFSPSAGETVSGRTLARIILLAAAVGVLGYSAMGAPLVPARGAGVWTEAAVSRVNTFLLAALLLSVVSWALALPVVAQVRRPCATCATRVGQTGVLDGPGGA